MSDISLEALGDRFQANRNDVLVVDIRHESTDDWHVPDGGSDVLELDPTNCAAK